MNRIAKWIVPAAVLACAFAGAGQQKKRGVTPKRKAPIAAPAEESPSPHPFVNAIRDNNLGIAYMERMDYENALGQFQLACILDPQTDAGCLNMGIALLSLKRYDQAKTIFEKSAERDAGSPRAWFNLGLIARIEGQPEAALEDFEKVRALDPADPAAPYFIAVVDAETRKDAQAIPNFQSAINMDPWNASAELGLSQALERGGDTDGSLKHLGRFRHLLAGDLGYTVTDDFGTQGKYALPEEIVAGPSRVGAAAALHFVDVTAESGLPVHFATESMTRIKSAPLPKTRAGKRGRGISGGENASAPKETSEQFSKFAGSGACVFDFDGDGRPDILLVNGDGKGGAALFRNMGGERFSNVTKSAGIAFHGSGTGCAAGDIKNDGRMDFAISSSEGVRLYENEGNGKFKDVTEAEGIHVEGLALGITFVDYDHDGFLDLYVTRFEDFPLLEPSRPFQFPEGPQPGNLLLRNTGHGKFVDVTAEMSAKGEFGSVGALATDVNNDGLTDLLMTGSGQSPTFLMNPKEGAFGAANLWTDEQPGATAGAAALDFDQDGWMDYAFTHWSNAGVSLWRNVSGLSFEKVVLPDPGWMRGWGICALDYDNDGWADLLAAGETFAGEGRLLLLRNEGAAGFRDVTHETGLDKIKLRDPRSVIAADFEGNGSLDLLVTQNTGSPLLLRSTGRTGNGWIDLGLKGTRDNRPGLDASATILAGDLREKSEVSGAAGYLGSGPATIHAGLGDFAQADVIRIFWPDGKKQVEMQLRGEKRVVLDEGTGITANSTTNTGTAKRP